MPRNMSFFYTQDQIRNKTKTVTRRLGWKFLKPGDILNAVEKAQGLGKGGKIKKICQIKVTDVYDEPLFAIAAYKDGEVQREGFEITPKEFIKMFCEHMNCHPYDRVQRIEFEYL